MTNSRLPPALAAERAHMAWLITNYGAAATLRERGAGSSWADLRDAIDDLFQRLAEAERQQLSPETRAFLLGMLDFAAGPAPIPEAFAGKLERARAELRPTGEGRKDG